MSPDVYFLIAGFLFLICCIIIGYTVFGYDKDGLDCEEAIGALSVSGFGSICWILVIPIGMIISLGFGISYIYIRIIQKKKADDNMSSTKPMD